MSCRKAQLCKRLAYCNLLATLDLVAETLPIRKFVSSVRNAATAVGNHSRIARAAMAFGRNFLSSVSHAAHILWLQITGCFFALFAMACGSAALREYRGYAAGKTPISHVWLTASLAVLFTYFAVSSFLHARRRGRGRT